MYPPSGLCLVKLAELSLGRVLYVCSDPCEGAICRNGQGTRAAAGS